MSAIHPMTSIRPSPRARAAPRGGYGRDRRPAGRRVGERGFTLVELLVALAAGLIVSAGAFLLARNASKLFQHEARISTAHYAAMMGLTRLQGDLQRAGFLSTPNALSDPLRCGDTATWPNGMRQLAGLTIINGGSVTDHETELALSVANNMSPDELVIGGSFHTTEQFAVRGIFGAAGGAADVYLQTNDGPMARTMAAAQTGSYGLAQIFEPGRMLRVIDDEGRESFGVILSFQLEAGTDPRISLATSPALPSKATTGVCGYAGMSIGALVNPVSRVRWNVRAVTASQYAPLYMKATQTSSGQHKGQTEAVRTELVRVELDADDVELPATFEVVAEYAVDLKFGITVLATPLTPTLQRYAIGDPNLYALVQPTTLGGTPEQVRAVQVRLTTRAAEPDREAAIDNPLDGGIFRFDLGGGLGFARVRSLVADVALPNM